MFDCGSKKQQEAFTENELRDAILKNVDSVTIFISHGDEDHYNYLPDLFPANGPVTIDRVIIGGDPKDYKRIQSWVDSIKEKLYTIHGGKMCIGDCNNKLQKWTGNKESTDNIMNICGTEDIRFDIIAANVHSQTNQKSIVLKVTAKAKSHSAGDWSLLLSGDIEGNAAETVAKQVSGGLKSNVYQISHHGACSQANKCAWLEAIQPQEAFVSHAYNWNFGHPRCDAITNLLSLNTVTTGDELNPVTHLFTCVKDKIPYTGRTCHNIFSTYPAENTICTVRFTIGIPPVTYYKCYYLTRKRLTPSTPPSEDSGDERPKTRSKVETGPT